MKKIIVILLILLLAALAYIFLPYAQRQRDSLFGCSPKDKVEISPNLGQCVLWASSIYHVPTGAVFGIMYVEGGLSGQEVGPNLNGTYDLGLMQVNSVWVPQLAELWHVDYRSAYNSVRDNGCQNIYVGSWILKQGVVHTGSLYAGIGSYHSTTPELGNAYAAKVYATMRERGLSIQP